MYDHRRRLIRRCPALFISASASGQGKTTVTLALARHYRGRGLRVRVFKTGPDFLDPMILERASAAPVYQLDLWMGGEEHCRQLLYEAAGDADLILVEGVMGLFDGQMSSADLASRFGIPVLAVIDGRAMAETFGAVAYGLANYRAGVPFAGVFANRVAGERHYRRLAESIPEGLSGFGWLPRDGDIALPERYLGLVQANEVEDLDTRIARASAALQGISDDLPKPMEFAWPPVEHASDALPSHGAPGPSPLRGVHVAVARDAAFAFLYRANLDLLRELGAELTFFSPLTDRVLPKCANALYLPGGYPELYLDALAANQSMKSAIRAHYADDKPIIAECGGMLYLLESLTNVQGQSADMVGLLPGQASKQDKLANLGLHYVTLPEGTLRGHTFHYSRLESPLTPIAWSKCNRSGQRSEAVYRQGCLHASYLHFYFPSNPIATARLFVAPSRSSFR